MAAMAIMAVCAADAYAERPFNEVFADSTLRVDFTMSGTAGSGVPVVAFSGLSKDCRWGGRRHRLSELPLKGNAEVTVTDAAGCDTLYRQSFSTLFQEWLSTGDTICPRAMDGSVTLPFPKQHIKVSITLFDNRGKAVSTAAASVDPADILIVDRTNEPPLPSVSLFSGAVPDSLKIKVAILAEGYTNMQMDEFLDHARDAVDAILSYEPFSTYSDYFDFVAIESPSVDSGVSIPKDGIWRRTAFSSHFSTFYSDRYLTTDRVKDIYDALTNTGCGHIIILANTKEYGGGGIYNFYTLTAARHEHMPEVVVHEFGHSFGGLGDEYHYDEEYDDTTYPLDVEPWEPNISTLVDFRSKWEDMVQRGDAALIEGAGYRPKGVYRGAEDCRMRSNNAPVFCPVCRRALQRIITFYTQPQ